MKVSYGAISTAPWQRLLTFAKNNEIDPISPKRSFTVPVQFHESLNFKLGYRTSITPS